MEWIPLISKGITGINWWITLYKSPAPAVWDGPRPIMSISSAGRETLPEPALRQGHILNLLITIALKTWGSQINSSKQNKVVLVVPSDMTLVTTTSSLLQGLCLQEYQLRCGPPWYLICIKGWLCSHSLLQLHIYEDLAPICFCSCVPLIPSPHCCKLPVPPAHGALTFHPFPLRAWSGAYPPNYPRYPPYSHYPEKWFFLNMLCSGTPTPAPHG